MSITQIATAAVTGSTTSGTTAGINTTGADLLVVVVSGYFAASPVLSVTDSKGNTWSSLSQVTNGTYTHLQIFYCKPSSVGSGHTVTGSSTVAFNNGIAVTFSAFSGTAISSVLDTSNGNAPANTSLTSIQAGSVTPANNGSLLIAATEIQDTSGISIDSGFTLDSTTAMSGAAISLSLGHLIQGSAGAINPTWSFASSVINAAAIAVFKPYVSVTTPKTLTASQSQVATLSRSRLRTLSATQGQVALVSGKKTATKTLSATQGQAATLGYALNPCLLSPAPASLTFSVPTSGTFPVTPTSFLSVVPAGGYTPTPPTLVAIVGSTTAHIMPSSLSIQEVVGQSEKAKFSIPDPHSSFAPTLFMAVQIDEDGVTLFRGDVDEVECASLDSPYAIDSTGLLQAAPVGARVWTITATGLSQIAAHNLTGSFSAQAKVAISTVVAALAASLGFATDIQTVPAGLALPNAFMSDQEKLSDAFTRLADLASNLTGVPYLWRITWSGASYSAPKFQFVPITAYAALPAVGTTAGYSVRAKTTRVRTTREQFANTVIFKLDKNLQSGLQTENHVGSDIFLGTLKLTYPCAGAPTILLNGATQTVGIQDIDGSKDWYWANGSNVLTVGTSTASGSDVLVVKYQGHDLRVVTAIDAGSVGAVGTFAIALQMSDSANALSPQAQANSELSRRNNVTQTITTQLRCPPGVFRPGMSVSCYFTDLKAYGVYYLRGLKQSDEEAQVVWRTLELVQGPLLYTSSQFMRRIGR